MRVNWEKVIRMLKKMRRRRARRLAKSFIGYEFPNVADFLDLANDFRIIRRQIIRRESGRAICLQILQILRSKILNWMFSSILSYYGLQIAVPIVNLAVLLLICLGLRLACWWRSRR